MSSSEVDAVVIGAGVVGLACAAEIAARASSVCLLERHGKPGLDTSTHNSGVIHAGIYYPPGTLKAKLCVEGKRLMYEFCARHDVPHARSGKLIVAPSDDGGTPPELEALYARGLANDVEELAMVDARFVRTREPHVRADRALWSRDRPASSSQKRSSGRSSISATRATSCWSSAAPPSAANTTATGWSFERRSETVTAATVVNCAGLYADDVSAMFGGEAFRIYPCRGEYAELTPAKRHLVNAPVYPLPHASGHGLGVHATKTTWGSVLLGPTIRFQARKDDYEADRLGARRFPRADARAAAERHALRHPAGRDRHPRETAPAGRVIR